MEDDMARTSRSVLRDWIEWVRRWWKKEPDLPGDPFANRMASIRRGPKGRSGTAAVAEPDEDPGSDFPIRAVGQPRK